MKDLSIVRGTLIAATASLCIFFAPFGIAENLPAAPPPAAQPAMPVQAVAQQVPSAQAQLDDYQIGPHDLLEISVVHAAEISRTVRVNGQGYITLPMLGPIRVGGLTSGELEEIIAAKLAKNYLRDPQVSVFIKEFVSQRVTVEGAVEKMGVFPLSGRMTLMQVVVMAGGPSKLADPTNVRIFRTGQNGMREVLVYDLMAIRDGEAEDPVIRGNDTVIVGASAGKTAFKTFIDSIRGFVTLGTIPLVGW